MKPQKRMCSSEVDIAVDRLGEMPDHVLVHILSLMPTRDAVRTMLIRRFGDLWTMVHYISFDFNEHYRSPRSDDPDDDDDDAHDEERRIMSEAFSRFARFVRNVLMFHRRFTIVSFHLDIGEYKTDHIDPWLVDDVQVWLKFATDREVRDLYFACDIRDELAPPRCIFTCQSLVTLTLCGSLFELDEQQPQLHMGSLRKLSLISVLGSNEALNQLISACPSLQELEIYNAYRLRDLNITAPSASRLDLTIADVRGGPFTLNCPHVEILDIALCRWSPSFLLNVIDVSSLLVVNVGRLPRCSSGSIIKEILRHFRDAKVFTLSSEAFEQLCCLEKVDIPQNRWLTLALQPWWDIERCLQVIIELVKSSEDLGELIIYSGESTASKGNHGVLSSELSTSCEMPLLKSVTILGYGTYREGQLQLIEFILRNAIILEKLVITCEENKLTAVEELEFLKQVLRFKTASANVIVEFA
ncbi:F-box/LRR-repeat protein At3g26922-like [Silene latifolia]|uniref:F-box/LRR-repeat protein At3g26922-like n=1 Tax=Silene latifolia TaxID=37657 RepID=UPI003D7745C7